MPKSDTQFKPGQSGNPGGRPKGFASLIRAETRDGAELVEFFLAVFRRKRGKLKHRIEAANWLADRGFGKPVQAMELSGRDGGPIVYRQLSDEELAAIASAGSEGATGEAESSSSA